MTCFNVCRFRQITISYYRGAKAVIIVFDLSRQASYDEVKTEVQNWVREAKVYVEENTRFLIMGNKTDLERVISKDEAKKLVTELAQEEKCSPDTFLYIETSAKTGDKIAEAFNLLATKLVEDVTNRL